MANGVPVQVTAKSFCAALGAALPEDYDWGRQPVGRHTYVGRDWTSYMAERLHDVARGHEHSCCCHLLPSRFHTDEFENRAGTTRGARREYLFDMTWYRDWASAYELPTVVVEHENAWHVNALLADVWKLMLARARLRVGFGYARREADIKKYVEKVRAVTATSWAEDASWSEDLILLGHYGMCPRGFRVLHRSGDHQEWRDLGLLIEAQHSV